MSAPSLVLLSCCSQDLARNNNSLDLGSAFANGAELGVAPVFFSWVVFGVTVAPMDLNSFFTNLNAYFGSKEFCHRRLFCRSPSLILEPGSAVHQQPCCIDLSCHRC